MPANILFWGTYPSVPATTAAGATGPDGVAGAQALYYFLDVTGTGPCRLVVVQPHPTSGGVMHIRWNATDAALTCWDAIVVPGDPPLASPYGLTITHLSVWHISNGTYGTNFTIRGWL